MLATSARVSLACLCLATAPQAGSPLLVNVEVAKSLPDIRVDAIVGELAARDTLVASFPTGGRIAEVDVEVGSRIAEGSVLARIESVQQEQALRAAKAGVATAEADYRQAQADLDRQNTLLARGAATRIARDAAEDAMTISEGALAQARAELDQARKALKDTALLAPANAAVIEKMVEPGQVVGAAQPVVKLALGEDLDAVFNLSEALIGPDTKGTSVALSLLDAPGTTFTGTVREISPLVDAATGTVKVILSVQDAPPQATYGDAVRGSAQRQTARHVVLPFAAMSATSDGPAVWVV
ncbi:MAG: efflux RND transporter periplasmic adaptor subunit, partial [Planctomycetes bacterium]|nr:efflux RND transporter periplasmic adaptor subunit [Planctomycetota bacterium]